MDNDPHKPDQEEQESSKKNESEIKGEGLTELDGHNPGNLTYLDRNPTLTFRSNWFSLNRASKPVLFNKYRAESYFQSSKLENFLPIDSTVPNHWLAIGPRNVNGRVKCLAVHPLNPNILYAGAASGGLWRSFDGGRNWELFWEDPYSPAIGSIDLRLRTPGDPDSIIEVLVGTGEAVGTATSEIFHNFPGNGVYYYDGIDWKHINYDGVPAGTTIEYYTISKVLFSGIPEYDFYVGGLDGFFGVKENNPPGTWTWTPIFAPAIISDAALDPIDSKIVYVCRDHNYGADIADAGIWKATDGKIFSHIDYRIKYLIGPKPIYKWPKISIGTKGPSGNQLILIKCGNSSSAKNINPIYITNPGSEVKKVVHEIVSNLTGPNVDWDSCIAIKPGTEDTFIAGTKDLKKFEKNLSGGWDDTLIDTVHDDQQMVVFSPSTPTTVYLANDGGVFKSTDSGDNWNKMSNGLQITQFYALGNWDKIGTALGGGTQDQGSIASQGGLTWDLVDILNNPLGRDGGYLLFNSEEPFNFIIERQRARPVMSNDGGNTFVTSSVSPCPSLGTVSFINPWLRVISQVQDGSKEFFFTADKRIFRVQTGVIPPVWEPISEDFFGVSDEFISAIGNSSSSPDIIYAGTGNLELREADLAKVYYFDAAVTIPCGDHHWESILPGSLNIKQPVTDIVVHPNDPGKVYISFGWSYDPLLTPSGFVWVATKSTTGSTFTWKNITGTGTDFPTASANAIILDPDNPHILYAGTDIGVHVLDMSGSSIKWKTAGLDLPSAIITDLRIDKRTRSLFAGSFGRGLYRLYLDGIGEERVYLRSNTLDTGEDLPIPFSELDPLKDNQRVLRWFSPDIKILNTADYNNLIAKVGGSVDNVDGVDFDGLSDSVIAPLSDYHILVQAHNRGWDDAVNVRVGIFYGKRPRRLPNGYNDLSSTSSDDRWTQLGAVQTIPLLKANTPKVLSWTWTNSSTHYITRHNFFAIIDSNRDPYTNTDRNPRKLAKKERKATLKRKRFFFVPVPPSPLSHFYDIEMGELEGVSKDGNYSIEIRVEGYRKGRMGLFLPPNQIDNVLKNNPELRSVSLSAGELENEWLTQVEGSVRDELSEVLLLIDSIRVIEFPNRGSFVLKDVFIEKAENFKGIFWGDHKTQNLTSIDFLLWKKEELIDGDRLERTEIKKEKPLPQTSEYVRVKFTLLKIEILENFDPWLRYKEKFSFFARLRINEEESRDITRRFPLKNYYEISYPFTERSFKINKVLFDGYLRRTDTVKLSVLGAEKDLIGPDDKLTPYSRQFKGNPKSWEGFYSPGDEVNDPEIISGWKIWYRIELNTETTT